MTARTTDTTRGHDAIIFGCAAAVVLAHIITALVTPYEIHRDEFLYMAMGRHLDLFRMEFPPFIAIVSELQRRIFGDALWSLRLTPAFAHGGLVVLTALLARRFGGSLAAQLFAMVAAALAPIALRAGSLFQPVIFDQLWWTLALYVLVRIAGKAEATTSPADWVWLGVAAGIGLLTKFTMLALGFGVVVGMLLSRREWLRTRGPWLTLAVALVVGSPSWIGQLRLGLPVIAQMGDLRATQLERITYLEFLINVIVLQGPAAFLLALTGVTALLTSERFKPYRVVGWACLAPALVIMLLRGKSYYIGPIFPTLHAAGGVVLAAALQRVPRRSARTALQLAAAVLLAGWGLYVLPLSLPIRSPEKTAAFAARMGATPAVQTNRGELLPLPQDFADMLGWKHKVERVARVYHSLPSADRRDAVIIGDNYGQTGAVDFYGPHLGLPPAYAPVGSYWFWGPPDKPGRVVIKIGGDAEDLKQFCRDVAFADRIQDRWLVPEEQDVSIWICRNPYHTLQEIWPMFRGQN